MAFFQVNLSTMRCIPAHLLNVVHISLFGKYNGIRMDIHPFFTGTQHPSWQAVHLHLAHRKDRLRPQIPHLHDGRHMKSSCDQNACNTGQRMGTGSHDHIRLSIFFCILPADLHKSCKERDHILYTGQSISLIFAGLYKHKGNPFLFGPKIRLPMCVHAPAGLMKLIGRKYRGLYSFFL